MGLGNARLLPVLLQNADRKLKKHESRTEALFKALAKLKALPSWLMVATTIIFFYLLWDMRLSLLAMKGLIDPKAELGRFQKDLDKVQKQYDASCRLKHFGNEGFVAKAPPAASELKAKKRNWLEFADQLQRRLKRIWIRFAALMLIC